MPHKLQSSNFQSLFKSLVLFLVLSPCITLTVTASHACPRSVPKILDSLVDANAGSGVDPTASSIPPTLTGGRDAVAGDSELSDDSMVFGFLKNTPKTGSGSGVLLEGEFKYRPPQVPLDAVNYPAAPSGLELQQVHVYVRHGERTPVGTRLNAPPASIPDHWIMCKTARQFRAAAFGGAYSANNTIHFLPTFKHVERVDGMHVEGECLLGELTDVGRQTTYNYGRDLRKLYVDRLGFLPDTLTDESLVYFRTTNLPRTTESLQQVIHGLYPLSKCASDAVPSVLVRNAKDDNLHANYSCKHLEVLQAGFVEAATRKFNPSLATLDDKLAKYLDGNGIRVDGKPRASGLMDTIRAAIANGIKVPPEFYDEKIVDTIEEAVVNEWFGVKTNETMRRLGMGPLLADLTRKMQNKIDQGGDQTPLRLLVHALHDTGIAALCATLDIFDDKWPAFTASVTFELFKQTERVNSEGAQRQQTPLSAQGSGGSVQHYVRMRYQNENMILPTCSGQGRHLEGFPEFCTLEAFKARVKELTPVDYEAECAM